MLSRVLVKRSVSRILPLFFVLRTRAGKLMLLPTVSRYVGIGTYPEERRRDESSLRSRCREDQQDERVRTRRVGQSEKVHQKRCVSEGHYGDL